MPTYEYRCESCGFLFEKFQTMKEDSLTDCPECGKQSLRRLIGAGAGLLFKGSGFYLTDYRKSNTSSSPAGGEKSSTDSDKSSGADAASSSGGATPTSPAGPSTPSESKPG